MFCTTQELTKMLKLKYWSPTIYYCSQFIPCEGDNSMPGQSDGFDGDQPFYLNYFYFTVYSKNISFCAKLADEARQDQKEKKKHLCCIHNI